MRESAGKIYEFFNKKYGPFSGDEVKRYGKVVTLNGRIDMLAKGVREGVSFDGNIERIVRLGKLYESDRSDVELYASGKISPEGEFVDNGDFIPDIVSWRPGDWKHVFKDSCILGKFYRHFNHGDNWNIFWDDVYEDYESFETCDSWKSEFYSRMFVRAKKYISEADEIGREIWESDMSGVRDDRAAQEAWVLGEFYRNEVVVPLLNNMENVYLDMIGLGKAIVDIHGVESVK